jgi:glucose/arabinose dehydrogenase
MNHIPRKLYFVFAAGLLCFGVVANAQLPVSPIPDPIPALIPFGQATAELQPVVASGFASPVTAAVAPGHENTLFVGDQTGQIWAVDVKKGDRKLFADLSGRLIPLGIKAFKLYDERGLLGLAFHPDFEDNGLFYTYASEPVHNTKPADFSTMPIVVPPVPPNCQNVLLEWHVKNPHKKVLEIDTYTPPRELLRIDKPQLNHNGGSLQFDKRKLLYLSLGDGGSADDLDVGHDLGGNGQSLAPGNVLGKILRIDPLGHNSHNGQYGIPSGNPNLGGSSEPEIYAYGFRNPWRTSFDRKTGWLYVGDVGQNDIEEVDIVKPGGNYGWPIKEGTFLFANRENCNHPMVGDPGNEGCAYQNSPRIPHGLIDPIAEYDHVDAPILDIEVRVAIVGGYVYRGEHLDGLEGRYVFGDYSQEIGEPVAGHLFYLDKNNHKKEIIIPSKIGPDGKAALGLAVLGFGEDAKGELYLLANRSGTLSDPDYDVSHFGTSGGVFKLVPVKHHEGKGDD